MEMNVGGTDVKAFLFTEAMQPLTLSSFPVPRVAWPCLFPLLHWTPVQKSRSGDKGCSSQSRRGGLDQYHRPSHPGFIPLGASACHVHRRENELPLRAGRAAPWWGCPVVVRMVGGFPVVCQHGWLCCAVVPIPRTRAAVLLCRTKSACGPGCVTCSL